MVTTGRITADTWPPCRARQAVAGPGRPRWVRSSILKASSSSSLSCWSSGSISLSARICMRCCSAMIRCSVPCWITAIRPTVKMANRPRIRLLRSTERLGVVTESMSFRSLAQAALGLAVAVGARGGVVVDSRCAEVHQQRSEGHRIGIVAPHANHVDQNADDDAEYQSSAVAGGAGARVGGDKEGAEDGSAAEQMKQR